MHMISVPVVAIGAVFGKSSTSNLTFEIYQTVKPAGYKTGWTGFRLSVYLSICLSVLSAW